MVHNGIEYGLMQAYAEGYELLEAESLIADVPGVLRAWSKGTVVRSWLLDLLVDALEEDPELAQITGYTEDSGEGPLDGRGSYQARGPRSPSSPLLCSRDLLHDRMIHRP